jgi:hypothetical protein
MLSDGKGVLSRFGAIRGFHLLDDSSDELAKLITKAVCGDIDVTSCRACFPSLREVGDPESARYLVKLP